ncbi:putative ABC transport system permease protein [Chitinophaga sp. YR573]|uniref:ABC transporter permease n=1 Tax=Chitinophaga sp. YR573 TaxID=1881040 RepID=UPI0008D27A8D|nr:FtsX-like permease family protein [Chitinophaga sp. YR573]SEW05392.1 putative ABC transport system permease protein [Chitinophaga sp. YR573]
MYRHLFKLIWNKRKQNFLLMSEMLVSFLVIFAVFTLLVYYYQNYKKPMGFDYEHVWVISYSNGDKNPNGDSLKLFYEILKRDIRAMPEVKAVGQMSPNIPFSSNSMQNGFRYKGKVVESVNDYKVDDSYKDVLHLKILEGRWFNKGDAVAHTRPVLINNGLREKLFGKEPVVGKIIEDRQIIGVVADTKFKGDYTSAGFASYSRIDTSNIHWIDRLLVNVTADAGPAFEGRLYKKVAGYIENSNVEIEHLVNKRKSINYFALVPIIVLSIVSCFLIINVALGLFGVLWYNINRRRGEIGLRRAIGATGRSVASQLVIESMILATFSLIIGTFFAVQFPLLNVFDLPTSVYMTALVLSIIFIYLLVLICAFYPGRQAAAIYPAVALHEE